MPDDPRTLPLKEWNRLARENAENALASSMFEAAGKSSEPMNAFSTWLLLGTAGVASVLITNAEKLLPIIKHRGFVFCGVFLCLSAFFGLLSKAYALRCKIIIDIINAIKITFAEQLDRYMEEEKKIKEGAKFWGISIETGIKFDRVIFQVIEPLPKFIRWQVTRKLKKNANKPQSGHFGLVRCLNRQSATMILQIVLFFAFMVAGFFYAAST